MASSRVTAVQAPEHARSVRRAGSPARLAGIAVLYSVLIVVLIAMAIPFAYMIAGSFKTNTDLFGNALTLLPTAPTLQNYSDLLDGSQIPYLRQVANSAIVGVGTTALTLAVCSLTGYGFAKFEFRFKRALFIMVLATLMVPAQITLVPLFLLMHSFGWLDSLKALVFPASFNAFGVFFMRQSMLAVPTELIEAARIDGASEIRLFWGIALPLVRAGLAVLGILTFLGAWNDFLWPIIVLQTDTNMTVSVGLASLNGLYHVRYGMIDAGAFLSTLPIIAAFIILRNQFLSGLTAGAFKGA
jgi:ABC-type glycerol-3-phosphate transport system permease component